VSAVGFGLTDSLIEFVLIQLEQRRHMPSLSRSNNPGVRHALHPYQSSYVAQSGGLAPRPDDASKSCPPTSDGLSLGGPVSKLLLDELIALASRILKLPFVENRHSSATIGNDARSA
jgi:hypothetical protein